MMLICSLWAANRAHGAPGAVVPFTSVEAESGYLGGGATIVSLAAPPTTPYSSPELEASGHAYVQLAATGQYVQWTNTTGQDITALNLRSCIPDAPGGGGITSTLNLYVSGVLRQAFSVNSLQNYCYEGTNYNGQSDKNPADGDPRDFWNDTHAFIQGAPVAPGDTIRFQMDSANTAAFYYIDVIDLEAPPPPLTQPANSLSIIDYGAISNNTAVDNTSAINNCFSAARTLGKIAWIPPGTYCINADKGGLNASGITIEGAGPWYSAIYRVAPANNQQGIANIIDATSCTLANVLLDCNAWSRDNDNNDGAVDFSGTNWLVTNVWIQHVTSSFWCAGVNGMAVNCRTLSTWADGGNFNNVQSANGIGMNLVYSNNFVRGTGDDAMAVNSVAYNVYGSTTNYYTTMSNIVYANNTTIAPWGGKGLGIYGGINVLAANNLLLDSARYLGLGVMKFGVNGSGLYSAVVSGNTLLRCGGNGYSQQQQAMMIGNGGDGQGTGVIENAYIVSNTIIDCLYDAIGFSTGTNIVLEYNDIISPGLDGVVAGPPDLGTGVAGAAVLNYNTLTGLNAGRSGFVNNAGNYVVGGIGNDGFAVPGPLPSPWQNQDVGKVATAGGASYSKNTFTLAGSGAGIGATADAFQFAYQPAYGDTSISGRVATEEIFNSTAQAGVIMRNSLDSADVEASLVLTPSNGVIFQWRSAYGGATSATALPTISAPYWVQLSRSGNLFTASVSPDGVNWRTAGSPAAVTMGSNILIGFASTSGRDGSLNSAMIDTVSAATPADDFPAVHWEGDLLVNLLSIDLTSASHVWTNRTSNSNTVGNFSTVGRGALNVTNMFWNSQPIKALWVNDTLANALQSALNVPSEITDNNPASVEAWIFATAVSQQNSCVAGYGIQGGASAPEEDREFNYSEPCCGGGVSGDFGSYDTPWATTPAAGAWHYLAWSYDGASVRLYLDGRLNASNNPSSPLATPATVLGIGGGIANSGPGISADPFQGCIAAVRVESGVLTPDDVSTNYLLGPLAGAAAVTPTALAASPGDGQVTLSWDPSGNASGYNVKRGSAPGGPFAVIAGNITGLSWTDAGLSNGVTYHYAVSATNSAGESPNSPAVSAQPIASSPPVFDFSIAGQQVQLSWPQDHTGWLLQAQTDSISQGITTNWTVVANSGASNQILVPLGLTNGTVFFRLVSPPASR